MVLVSDALALPRLLWGQPFPFSSDRLPHFFSEVQEVPKAKFVRNLQPFGDCCVRGSSDWHPGRPGLHKAALN